MSIAGSSPVGGNMEICEFLTSTCCISRLCEVCGYVWYFSASPGVWICYDCEALLIRQAVLDQKAALESKWLQATAKEMNKILTDFYYKPIVEQLNDTTPWIWGDRKE